MDKFHTVLLRQYEPTQTVGHIMVYKNNALICVFMTLEPVNNGNKKGGCILEGTYEMQKEFSPGFRKDLLELKGVKDRTEIKIHVMNLARESRGCIGVGLVREDINSDGNWDLTQSKTACDTLFRLLPKKSSILITS